MMYTEFKYKILKDNKHCKYVPIEQKDDNCPAYLSTTLLDSILINSNKHYPQIFLEKWLYPTNKKKYYWANTSINLTINPNNWLWFFLPVKQDVNISLE